MLLQYYASNTCFKSTTEECFLLIDSAAELLWFLGFVLFAGGADKNVVVFDKSSEQILATLKGHTKKVTSVVFHPSQVRALDFLQDFSVRKSQTDYIYTTISKVSRFCHTLVEGVWSTCGLTELVFEAMMSFCPPGTGVLSISRCHYPYLVSLWRFLCAGCTSP